MRISRSAVMSGIAVLLSCLTVTNLGCHSCETLTRAEKEEVISRFSRQLQEYYLFPEVAERYVARMKTRLEEGAYDSLVDRADFARQVTEDLRSIHEDRHLALRDLATHERKMAELQSHLNQKPRTRDDDKHVDASTEMTTFADVDGVAAGSHHGFKKLEFLDGDIALVEINLFPASAEAVERAHEVMQAVADSGTVIFDIRHHRGGSMEVIDAIASYLFSEPTHMVSMVSRAHDGGAVQEHISQPSDMSERFVGKPIYVLTSRKTGSAGEHFAAAMKYTRRAVLVGEPTHGAGHFGANMPVTERFVAFIPYGRTYDPNTGEDWEGVGVLPDIEVGADDALDAALELARSR